MPATKDYQKFAKHGLHWVGGADAELAQAHVLFVHGLGGNAYSTWTSNAKNPDFYWPAWVADDFANEKVAVWAYCYDASPHIFKGKPQNLEDSGMLFLQHLEAQALIHKPITLIVHSLGGLISKVVLRKLNDLKSSVYGQFHGIVFYGTPHFGSPLKSAFTPLDSAASELAKVLDFSHPTLLSLNDWFRNHWSGEKALTFIESEELTVVGKVVPAASADAALPNAVAYTIPGNHMDMCKFITRSELTYIHTATFIRKVLFSTSNNATSNHLSAQAHPPQQRINLPHSLGVKFIGRDQELLTLHQALQNAKGHDVALSTHALQGMGGYGKTRLAVEYAHRYHTSYSYVLMLDVQSPSALDSALANLCDATALNLSVASTQTEARVQAAKAWLAQNTGWLVIADNADTEEAAKAVANLAQALPQGRFLVTTRLDAWGDGFSVVKLHKLSHASARHLLLTFSGLPEPTEVAEQQALVNIITKLDGYTLALRVAASYIRERGIRFGAYLHDWENIKNRVLTYNMPKIGDYDKNMLASLMLSVDNLEADARALLERLAWIAPSPIPSHLLDTPLKGVSDVRGALSQLVQRGLVDAEIGEQGETTPQIHRVLQEVVRTQCMASTDSKSLLAQSWVDALYWLVKAFQGNPANVTTWPKLLPLEGHVHAVFSSTTDFEPSSIAGCDWHNALSFLYNQLGILSKERAEWEEADPLYRRALAIDEASYGENHPEVAINLNNLANLLEDTNRLVEAEPLYRRALAIDEVSYGENHPTVAIDLNNLACLLEATNRSAEAEPMYRRALAIGEASYGENHPTVAIRLNNLAYLLEATNRLAEAEPMYRRALAITEASYGKYHPTVAIRLNNLAGLLEATNRLAEAEPFSRRHLEIFVKFTVLHGHEHPHLKAATSNYIGLLVKMQLPEPEIKRRLEEIMRPLKLK